MEYVAERVASSCVKHICSTLLQSVRKQGAKHVSQLISTSTVLSTMNSESKTSVKQLKVCLTNMFSLYHFRILWSVIFVCLNTYTPSLVYWDFIAEPDIFCQKLYLELAEFKMEVEGNKY